MSRESMEFDFVIVGAGPAGLSTAIRLAQLGKTSNTSPNICVIDKGESVGAHILSGAVLEPRTLNELLPDWREKNAPLDTPAREDQFFRQCREFGIDPNCRRQVGHGPAFVDGDFSRILAHHAKEEVHRVF